MASVVDICNLALAHLGDTATVASIDPPEQSAQAGHCARFYYIARDALLEMHRWNFASKQKKLTPVAIDLYEGWTYAYAIPADFLTATSLVSKYDIRQDQKAPLNNLPDYDIKLNPDNVLTIYTDQEEAVLKYQAKIVDATTFSPLFVTTLSWHLASILAGVIIKGEEGYKQAIRCSEIMSGYLQQAASSDANQQRITMDYDGAWGRRI
jgi:hypothetical protein